MYGPATTARDYPIDASHGPPEEIFLSAAKPLPYLKEKEKLVSVLAPAVFEYITDHTNDC